WRLTSNTDPGYEFIATHTSGGGQGASGSGASSRAVDEWEFLLRYPDGDGTVEKRFTYHEETYSPPVSSGCDGKCKNKHNRKAAYYELKCPSDGYELLVTVYDDDADGASDAVVYTETKAGKTERKCLEPLDDGVVINQQTYQWDADGYLTKNGKRVNQTTTVEVNGVKVPVSMPTWLGSIKLGSQPIEFRFDRMHCVLSGVRMDVHVYLFPAGPVHIKADDVAVHWLHIKNCDGRWRDRDLHQKGRHFHRMKVLTADQKWLYETITVGSYLTDMNWRKLFTRAAARHGELPAGWWYVPTGPGMPGGDPLDGDREVDGRDDDTVWDEDAAAPWSEYPEWARPARAPANSGAQQLNFGGYQDVDHGRPAACGDATVDYAFSATCPARYPTPLNPFTSRVPAALKKSLPRKVGFPRFDGNNVVIPDLGRVNPLFLLYFPKEWEAVVQNDVAASARGIPDYVNNDGNPYPGYWIEGPFYREVELSDEQRAQGLVTLEQRVLQYKAGFSGRMWLLDQESPATRVEFPCAAFRRKTAEGDLWYLVVFDPLGAVPIFRQEPRYYGTAVAFYDRNSQLPDGASDYEAIARIPAMVRRTLGPGASAGRTGSVKEYLTEKNYLAEDPKHDWTVPAGMALELDDFDRGLEAMSELFRRPLVVGVHAPATFGWLAGLFGRDRDKMGQKARDMGLGNPLYVIGDEGSGYAGRKWSSGHFAFAAARVFFSAPDGGWVTNFRYGNAGAQYASSFADSMNLIKQELPGAGQKWQKSTYNLFEPSWTAALVPFNAAVRLRDLYGDVGEADFNTEDSPTSYLFRQLVRVDWRRNMADSGFGNLARDGRVSVHKITAPPRQGHHNAVNLNNSGIDAVTCH
ncbi:MAG: hypothetical protein J6333_08875, partial [Planctomycetes bacterium]|nr:hypothetical protein [Planctomycetota bacterium]